MRRIPAPLASNAAPTPHSEFLAAIATPAAAVPWKSSDVSLKINH